MLIDRDELEMILNKLEKDLLEDLLGQLPTLYQTMVLRSVQQQFSLAKRAIGQSRNADTS